MCGLQHAQGDEEHEFLGSASKPRSTVCQWFGFKTTTTVSPGLASKPAAMVSPGLASKPMATVFVVWPQNHSLRFFGFGLKTSNCGLVI
jgi:hypothetical protein